MAVRKTTSGTKKATAGRGRGNTWKSIDQEVKRKDMSDASRRHFRVIALKRVVYAVCGLIVGGLVAKFTLFDDRAPELLSKAGRSMPVERVEIQSDGSLNSEWTMRYLGLRQEDLDLLTVDIRAIKAELEKIPQVAEASIHRDYEDRSLFVSIQERSPIARISGGTRTGEVLTLFVDGEGVVYEARNYERQMVRSLPYLAGVRLKRSETGFEQIRGLSALEELLREARSVAPHIYRTWDIVSMELAPRILVKGGKAREAVFGPTGFRHQLARLDYILDHERSNPLTRIERVDLTLGSQVPARLGN